MRFAIEDLDQRVEFEVPSGRHRSFSFLSRKCFVAFHRFSIFRCRHEGVLEKGGDAHARVRISVRRSHHVLTECELDSRLRTLKMHRLGGRAPSKLDDCVLSTDRVRGTMQLVGCGQTPGKLSIPVDVVGIENVTDADFGGVVLSTLVHTTIDPRMGMTVDQAGGDLASLEFEDSCAFGGFEIATDGDDAAVGNQKIRVLENAGIRRRPDSSVSEEHGLHLRLLRPAEGTQWDRKSGEFDLTTFRFLFGIFRGFLVGFSGFDGLRINGLDHEVDGLSGFRSLRFR